MRCLRVFTLLSVLSLFTPHIWADALIVTTPNGKDAKVEGIRFLRGTRTIPWIQAGEKNAGPEFLEFREEKSTTYENGILTLIPVKSLKKVEYDSEKKSVRAVVHLADNKDANLQGPTKYVNLNKILLEGDVSLEGVGSARLKMQGGAVKDGLKGFRYEPSTPVAPPMGPAVTLVAADKEKTSHRVFKLLALYQSGKGPIRVFDKLHFKTTVKLPLDEVTQLKLVASDPKANTNEYAVTIKDGTTLNLAFLTKVDIDGQPAQFVGFFGQVDVGYKLFPLHTVSEIRREK